MIGKIKAFNSLGPGIAGLLEDFGVDARCGVPLSGYLAGKERGGLHVRILEDAWAKRFQVSHAIACNSATSGLLAAADAAGLDHNSVYACPTLTMSATVAAPRVLGATPYFMDADPAYFGIEMPSHLGPPDAIFVTSLFGHPADLIRLREYCDNRHIYMIEDAAQSPFAMEDGRYAGTIGHIGVFSLNVHKPLQAGEGGVIVTDNDYLAKRMRGFINHGENMGQAVGLNLRLSEISAAIALAQLERADEIIGGRIAQAEKLIKAIEPILPGILPPTRIGCKHVYYTVPFQIEQRHRIKFCAALRKQGVPIVEGYTLAHRLPVFEKLPHKDLPHAEELHDHTLFYFENCAYDLTDEQIGGIGEAFKKAAEKVL